MKELYLLAKAKNMNVKQYIDNYLFDVSERDLSTNELNLKRIISKKRKQRKQKPSDPYFPFEASDKLNKFYKLVGENKLNKMYICNTRENILDVDLKINKKDITYLYFPEKTIYNLFIKGNKNLLLFHTLSKNSLLISCISVPYSFILIKDKKFKIQVTQIDNCKLYKKKYDTVTHFNNDIAFVKFKKKWGFITTNGYESEIKYDEICFLDNEFIKVKVNDKYGLINKNLKTTEIKYDYIYGCSELGYILAELDKRLKVLDKDFNEMIYIVGYKGTNRNMICKGFQYEIGKVYKYNGKVKMCESGFHFCPNLKNVFNYYELGRGNRYFKVKVIVNENTYIEGDKIVSDNIEILREVVP